MFALKRFLKSRLERGPVPLRVAQEIRLEAHLLAVRLQSRLDPRVRVSAKRMRTWNDIRLHFGCGTRILPGWLNVDGWRRPGVDLVWDLRQPLPLATGACRVIFTEHVLEHIDRQFRDRVLRQFYRLLEPGGTVRIVIPNCARYAEAYVRNDMEWFRLVLPGCRTRGEGLNNVFIDHFHRYIDDFETLEAALKGAGFTNVAECKYRGSPVPDLRIDSENESRNALNLYVEARK